MSRNTGFVRRAGGRKRSRVRVRKLVFFAFILLTLTAAVCGLAVNRHIEQVWEAHWKWLEEQNGR